MKRYMLYINGPDQVGIVAAVTQSLTRLRCNLEDSRMTILRGQFSIMMTIAVNEIPQEVIQSVLDNNSQMNLDGNTFLAANGAESFQEDVNGTKQIIEYALKEAVDDFGLHSFLVELEDDLISEENTDPSSEPIVSSGGGNCLFVSVHGIDQIGIVSQIAAKIKMANSSIVDLATRLVANVYVLVMTVELAEGLAPDTIARELTETADGLGVTCKISSADPDLL